MVTLKQLQKATAEVGESVNRAADRHTFHESDVYGKQEDSYYLKKCMKDHVYILP